MATSNPRKMLVVAALAAMTSMLAGCGPQTLGLHVDSAPAAGIEHHLEGVRVVVRSVVDKRAEHEDVGRHRDGFLRVTQYHYVPSEPIEKSVAAALAGALRDAGATVVEGAGESDVQIDVSVTALDVTTDGMLAGEETFGVVTFDVRITSGNAAIGNATITEPFAVDDVQEPWLLRDALQRAARKAVRTIRRSA